MTIRLRRPELSIEDEGKEWIREWDRGVDPVLLDFSDEVEYLMRVTDADYVDAMIGAEHILE